MHVRLISAGVPVCCCLDLQACFKVFFLMDVSSRFVVVTSIFMLTFVLNLFFGYFRVRTKKYSFKWFLFIHLPIPVVVFARLYAQLDYRVIPVFLLAAVAGQIVGGRIEI